MSFKFDRVIVGILLVIAIFSLMVLYSGCHQKGEFVRKAIFFKQILWLVVSFVAMVAISQVNYRKLKDFVWPLYWCTLALLAVVLIIGHIHLGAQRWFSIWGFNFQPSEVGKFSLILLLSRYFSQKSFEDLRFSRKLFSLIRGFVVPFFFMAIPAGLVMLQPDLGTAIVYGFIFLVLVFFCGVRLKYLSIFFVAIGLFCPFFWSMLRDYQKDRLLVFLNPNRDPLGAGYTIIQSKIAIGSGQLFGKGWLSGTQNQLNFLTERHTDFIFSIIGEEWGFIGAVVLLGLFYLLVRRLIRIASLTLDPFAQNLCLSIAGLLCIQFFVNIAMTIGIMPVVGLPLPFISYGGSSLLSFYLLMGIALSISKTI